MTRATASVLAALFAGALLSACAGSGGSGFFGGGNDSAQRTGLDGVKMTEEEAAALRKLAGPSYCPTLVTPRGGESLRVYAEGHDDDPGFVVWQASLGETARECEYDGQGTLTIKIGVSGRLVLGPAGQPGTITIPLQIAVEKFKEATLASEVYPLSITVGPRGSIVFREVYRFSVPSPGGHRDYLVKVGFQTGEEGTDNASSDEADTSDL